MGRPLMPWQQYQADVAGELDSRGLLRWPVVVTTVQRQAGKTTLDLATSVQRCLWRPDQRVWHTAQTGQDARDGWREFVSQLMDTPLKELVSEVRKGNGQEVLRFVNGSTFRPHPPTHDALHGKQGDCNNIDEGWAFDEAQGAALLQAIAPTQLTRPGAQTFIWSTMGDATSVWFHNWVDRGLSGEPGLALFYWGLQDDDDPDDDAVIASRHPALGYTATAESLVAARVSMKDPAQYARAYGNRRTGGRRTVIPAGPWAAARTQETLPAGRPAYGVAVYEPRDGGDVSAAVVAAVVDAGGRPWLEVLAHRPGRAWATDYVLALRAKDPGLGVAVDRRGPSAPIADALELAGVDLLPLTAIDQAAACQDLWDRIAGRAALEAGPQLLHRGPEDGTGDLDTAVDVAGRKFIGEGAWVWSDLHSTGDQSALKAATLAAWAVARAPVPMVVGRTMFA